MNTTTTTTTNAAEFQQPTQGQAAAPSPSTNRPWYTKGSLPLGSCIAGIPIYLHYTFFLLLGLMILTSLLSRGVSDPLYILLMAILYGPVLLITIVIHEFGHALTTKCLGGTVGDMVLWPLGGFVFVGPTDHGVWGDLQVAMAGPLTHIPQAGAWLGIFVAANGGSLDGFSAYVGSIQDKFWAILAEQAFFLNVALMVFNLFVPAYPLDGGRVLAATLVLCGMPVVSAATCTSVIGMLFAAALVVYGILNFFWGSPLALFTALIGGWIGLQSYRLFATARPAPPADGRENLKHHPIFGRECYQERIQQNEQQQQQQQANSNHV